MFDYKLIEALAMVARDGGFDKAANTLCITQSAVSQRVKLLEELTGQVLMVRTSPPRATLAGQKLLKHYLQVKRLEDELIGDIGDNAHEEFSSLAVAINADSLAFWLLEAIQPFLLEERVLLDIRVDDQEQTHRLLKDGEVMGCISTQENAMQGCLIEYLGSMKYHLIAAPDFATRYFPNGLTVDNVRRAPALFFNRNDELHRKLLSLALEEVPVSIPINYVPSVEKHTGFIVSGLAYGVVPDRQSTALIQSGQAIDLSPDVHVSTKLYWHCWSLESKLLNKFTQQLTDRAKPLLDQ